MGPLIVDADVDPRWAAEQAAAGAFAYAGQICVSVERITDALVEVARASEIAPLHELTQLKVVHVQPAVVQRASGRRSDQ